MLYNKMKKRQKKKKLSSPRLKDLEKDFKRIASAENYLESERKKLVKDKEKIRIKIKKEKEILRLENQIKRVKSRKKI